MSGLATEKSSFMTKKSQMRLLKDVVDIIKNPLSDQGIYYIHDEDNMKKGYALVFGPSDTLYQFGSYLFEFKFPNDYPFSPPKLTYSTNNGRTRFNPNLYRNGKVCISILNTWKGEQWTSCQTIRSILLTLVTLLHNKPLLNEPGITEKHPANEKYNKIIKYQNYKTAVYNALNKSILNNKFESFFPIIKKHIFKNQSKIKEDLKLLADSEQNDEEVYCSVYNMKCSLRYKDLLEDFNILLNKLSN